MRANEQGLHTLPQSKPDMGVKLGHCPGKYSCPRAERLNIETTNRMLNIVTGVWFLQYCSLAAPVPVINWSVALHALLVTHGSHFQELASSFSFQCRCRDQSGLSMVERIFPLLLAGRNLYYHHLWFGFLLLYKGDVYIFPSFFCEVCKWQIRKVGWRVRNPKTNIATSQAKQSLGVGVRYHHLILILSTRANVTNFIYGLYRYYCVQKKTVDDFRHNIHYTTLYNV